MEEPIVNANADPGVPEASAFAVRHLREQVDPERVQHLWFFPPLRQGRRETGLLAASLAPEDGSDERRILVTVRYTAEATGKGIKIEPALREEGEAPPDRIPRVIRGVLQRSDVAPGEPREIPVGGDVGVLDELGGEGAEHASDEAGAAASAKPPSPAGQPAAAAPEPERPESETT